MHLYPTEGPDLFEMSQSCLFFPDSSLALLRKAREGMASEAGGTVPRAPRCRAGCAGQCLCLQLWVPEGRTGQLTSLGFLVPGAAKTDAGRGGRKECGAATWQRWLHSPRSWCGSWHRVFPAQHKQAPAEGSWELGAEQNSSLPFVLLLNLTGISSSNQTFAADSAGVLAFLVLALIKSLCRIPEYKQT